MHRTLPLLLGCLCTAPSLAVAARPHALGRYGDWVAVTYDEAGQTVCYAFTRALAFPGDPDADGNLLPAAVVLTVTQRPSERDDVAIAEGFTLPHDQPFQLTVDGRSFDFYTSQHAAFARDGAAVVAALAKNGIVMDHAIGPHAMPISDQFSLRGFSAAYAATTQACPEH